MILGAYLLFVQRIGPQFMVHRKPYQLRSILLTYNFLQVIFNFYTATAGFYHSYWQPDFDYAGYNHYNGTITTTTSFALANICYFYFWTKVFDLFDTVFFVLRKKSNQISFLHIYHHCTMIFVEYIHNKYFAGMHERCGVGLVWKLDYFSILRIKDKGMSMQGRIQVKGDSRAEWVGIIDWLACQIVIRKAAGLSSVCTMKLFGAQMCSGLLSTYETLLEASGSA